MQYARSDGGRRRAPLWVVASSTPARTHDPQVRTRNAENSAQNRRPGCSRVPRRDDSERRCARKPGRDCSEPAAWRATLTMTCASAPKARASSLAPHRTRRTREGPTPRASHCPGVAELARGPLAEAAPPTPSRAKPSIALSCSKMPSAGTGRSLPPPQREFSPDHFDLTSIHFTLLHSFRLSSAGYTISLRSF